VIPKCDWCFLEQTCLGTKWNMKHASWRTMSRTSHL